MSCNCRRNGLPCMTSCTGCRGEECANSMEKEMDGADLLIDDTGFDAEAHSERDNIFDLINSEFVD